MRANFITFTKINHVQSNNFKGIWGNPENDHYEDSYNVIDSTTEHYYPFADETDEKIRETISPKIYATNNSGPQGIPEPVTTSKGSSVIVHTRYPFTAKEYEAYITSPKKLQPQKIAQIYSIIGFAAAQSDDTKDFVNYVKDNSADFKQYKDTAEKVYNPTETLEITPSNNVNEYGLTPTNKGLYRSPDGRYFMDAQGTEIAHS